MPITRQTPDFDHLTPDGKGRELKEPAFRACQVAIEINASPTRVMEVLTRASDYTRWNSTLISFAGTITEGQKITLVSKLAPKRTFRLAVSALGPNAMTWEDGMPFGLFRAVRSFRATPTATGSTTFAASKTCTPC